MANPKQYAPFWWLLLLPIPLLWCLAGSAGLLEFLENKLIDSRFRFRGEIAAPVRVVYVDVDAESITDLGNQPWDRGYYAEVCAALIGAGQVRAIGIDFVFSEKGQPELLDAPRFAAGNQRLAELLFSGAPIVAAAGYASTEDRDINGQPIVRKLPRVNDLQEDALPPELPEFRAGDAVLNPPHVGLIDTINGGTRWVPLFARVGELTYLHMAVELARLYWQAPRENVQIQSDVLEIRSSDGSIKAAVPLHDGQDVEVNWFSRWSSPQHNPRASFVDVLVHARGSRSANSAERAAAEQFFAQFRDAVVLIGPVDPLLQDIAPTPLDPQPVPRVGIHGNLLKTIVSGEYIHRLHLGWNIAITLALTAAVSALAVGTRLSRGWMRFGAVALAIVYVAAAFLAFSRFHLILPLVMPLGAAFSTSFAAVGWQLAREERQKGRIKSMFGTYVSPELVDRMVESGEDPKLGGAEVEITAYFSDIQDFSSFSEQLSPTQVVELMNEYLTACTDIITSEGGTLDKYIGDAVVAMFGAPLALSDHAYRACRTSVRVQERLQQLREGWSRDSRKWPVSVARMHTRVGLNTGTAVVGNMGSMTRFNYTMMGDSVNIAARLEGAAKIYGATTLVTEQTKAACELKSGECLFRFIDRIVVKGRAKPVAVYELVGFRHTASDLLKDAVSAFEEAMELYLRQDWARAIGKFEQVRGLEARLTPNTDTTPAAVYLRRCEHLRANPPAPDWDGVWVLQSK